MADLAAAVMAQYYWQGEAPLGMQAAEHPSALTIHEELDVKLLPALLGAELAMLARTNVLSSSESHRTGTFELVDFISFVNAFGQGGTLAEVWKQTHKCIPPSESLQYSDRLGRNLFTSAYSLSPAHSCLALPARRRPRSCRTSGGR